MIFSKIQNFSKKVGELLTKLLFFSKQPKEKYVRNWLSIDFLRDKWQPSLVLHKIFSRTDAGKAAKMKNGRLFSGT